MRSDFVANVSHEIRSPLTAISGFVETLQGDASDDPDASKLFLGLMEKEVARMTNLVSDLLSLSKVEAKERRAPKNPLDVNQTIQQSGRIGLRPGQINAAKQLEIDVTPNLPSIRGKRDDLARALYQSAGKRDQLQPRWRHDQAQRASCPGGKSAGGCRRLHSR